MNAPYLPPVARPPHDPLRWRLDRRAGWRTEPHPGLTWQAGPAPGAGDLTLTPLPGSVALLSSADGSFGGLTWPDHAALLPGDELVLLDRVRGRLRRFDACACRFVDWPCLGRDPADQRRPLDPGGISAGCGRLYLTDSGHRRVLVINPVSGSVQAVWTSPAVAGLQPWQPEDVAVLPDERVAVSDAANGGVHLFTPHGRHLRFLSGLGAVRSLAADCAGRLYVRIEGEERVRVLDAGSGRLLESLLHPGEAADRFPPLPVRVLRGGVLDLSGFGSCPPEPPPLFDAAGELTAAPPAPAYPKQGQWVSRMLDSEITRCPWHAVLLAGTLPPGARVSVYSWTAESEEPADLLALKAPEEWQRAGVWQVAAGETRPASACDLALRSPPGRYLWLKLVLEGNGSVTPSLRSVEIEFPRISLRRYLPAVFGAEPLSADFTDRLLAIFDRTLRGIETTIDRQALLFDPLACPSGPGAKRDFLSWLAGWVGVALERNWPEARRRAYLKSAPQLFPWRGTLEGLRASLYLFLGLDRFATFEPARTRCVPCATVPPTGWRPPRLLLEHFHLRRWMLLDHARLSDNAKLWGERIVNRSRLGGPGEFSVPGAPSGAQLGVTQLKKAQDPCRDPFHVYAHKLSIFAPAACLRDPSTARALQRLVELERPAHVQAQVVAVEPRFRVGMQSMLGLDAVIGWRAQPVRLDEGTLGRATVLTGAVDPRPRFRVGDARIGEKTILP